VVVKKAWNRQSVSLGVMRTTAYAAVDPTPYDTQTNVSGSCTHLLAPRLQRVAGCGVLPRGNGWLTPGGSSPSGWRSLTVAMVCDAIAP